MSDNAPARVAALVRAGRFAQALSELDTLHARPPQLGDPMAVTRAELLQ